MSALKEQITPLPSRLGIIAGGGDVPQKLIYACDRANIEIFIVGFEGHTNPDIMEGREHLWARLGGAGAVIKTLKSHEIEDLVLIGSIRRPSLSELKPDLKTAAFFAKIGLKGLGDQDLLSHLRDFLEGEGFALHGVHKFMQELLTPEGVMGKQKPGKDDHADIAHGLKISQEIGRLDIGQSVIVQEGIVLGVEGAEGTDELIQRCKHLKRQGRGGVLVKTCKPQQDRDLDLPTIGPDTIEQAAFAELSGIVIHAGASLILDQEAVIEAADKHKIFIMGAKP